ncbi:unnamed protein product [Caenorhabditis nigoni]
MRIDIQCLRGLAISFVLIYHLFPLVFVNGYLGVDMFFVISGYLMARILNNSKINNISDILNFYYRRLKRILPLYYLFCAVALIFVHLYLGEFWWDNNRKYSLAALFLVSNQVFINDAMDYFLQYQADGTSLNAFMHTWSLGVEFQFYLLAPFIFFGIQSLPKPTLKLAAVSTITFFGMCAFLTTNTQFAFNFMLLRLWQFSAGFTALFWREFEISRKSTRSEKSSLEETGVFCGISSDDVVTCVTSVLFLCLVPSKIDPIWLRPLITFATAFLIYMETEKCQILKSKSLEYLGNISYAVYLIHWPVITIFMGTTVASQLYCLILTMIISIVTHHCNEKQYLKLDKSAVGLLILLLLLFNASVQYSTRNHQFWKPKYLPKIQKIVKENEAMIPFDTLYKKNDDECVETAFQELYDNGYLFTYCKYPRGKGKLSVMVIGNSYAKNLNEHIRTQFHHNYSEWRTLVIGGSVGFYHDNGYHSAESLITMKNHVETHKPDVLFIAARYPHFLKSPILNEEDDDIVKQMNSNIAFYEQYVKKIYILAPHPLYPLNFLNIFLDYVTRRPTELETLHLNREEVDRDLLYARERFELINCKKCKVFDLSKVFLENDKYLSFDRKTMLSYMDTGVHFTAPGITKCDTVFESMAKEVMETIV